jgi:hypothetical protein
MRVTHPQHRLLAGVLVLAAAGTAGHAQKTRKTTPETQSVELIAVTALDSAVDELREVEDISLRASMAEEIVKLLATKKPARCRQLLEALFDDALRLRKAQKDGATSRLRESNAVIQRTIKIAASFDPKLAQEFVDEYAGDKESAGDAGGTPNPSPSAADLYIRLATDLVERDPTLAVSVAEKSLVSEIGLRTLIFLETLRKKDQRLAGDFTRAVLQSIGSRQGRNINELLLLYSYVFSPLKVPIFTGGKLAIYESQAYRSIAESHPIEPDLARYYLQRSSQIILDPSRHAAGSGQLTAGAAGDLSFINLLFPHAGMIAPELSEPLRGQQAQLMSLLDADQRATLQVSTDRWNTSLSESGKAAQGSTPGLEDTLRRAEKSSDPDQKDQLYYTAATLAVQDKKYADALDIVDKLSDKSRGEARKFIMFSIAEMEVKDGQLERAEEWAKRDDDLARRAFILNLVADALSGGRKRDIGRASEILEEVRQLAAKLDPGQEKVSTLIGASAVYARYDNVRAVELLQEAIRAANQASSFAGDTRISRAIKIGGFGFFYYMYYDRLTFEEVIGRLGKKDFTATLADLQGLKNRPARLRAIISLCAAAISRTMPVARA